MGRKGVGTEISICTDGCAFMVDEAGSWQWLAHHHPPSSSPSTMWTPACVLAHLADHVSYQTWQLHDLVCCQEPERLRWLHCPVVLLSGSGDRSLKCCNCCMAELADTLGRLPLTACRTGTLLWSLSKPACLCFCVNYPRGPCLGREVGLHGWRSLPTAKVLWLCEHLVSQVGRWNVFC